MYNKQLDPMSVLTFGGSTKRSSIKKKESKRRKRGAHQAGSANNFTIL